MNAAESAPTSDRARAAAPHPGPTAAAAPPGGLLGRSAAALAAVKAEALTIPAEDVRRLAADPLRIERGARRLLARLRAPALAARLAAVPASELPPGAVDRLETLCLALSAAGRHDEAIPRRRWQVPPELRAEGDALYHRMRTVCRFALDDDPRARRVLAALPGRRSHFDLARSLFRLAELQLERAAVLAEERARHRPSDAADALRVGDALIAALGEGVAPRSALTLAPRVFTLLHAEYERLAGVVVFLERSVRGGGVPSLYTLARRPRRRRRPPPVGSVPSPTPASIGGGPRLGEQEATMNTPLDPQDPRRAAVRDTYGRIARGEARGCCGPDAACGPKIDAGRYGYDAESRAAAPEGADLGLGCGNPQALATLAPGETVLDLGAGAGFDALLAARAVGPGGRVIGVDMTPEMVAKARGHAARLGVSNLELRLGEIEHLPVADASVDVILSNCVLNLCPDLEPVLAEAHRVLKPGGRLAIADVVRTGAAPEGAAEDLEAWAGCAGGARTPAELEAALLAAGFEAVRVTVRPESAALIRDWRPGAGLETWLASATLEARRPGPASCCGPSCCDTGASA